MRRSVAVLAAAAAVAVAALVQAPAALAQPGGTVVPGCQDGGVLPPLENITIWLSNGGTYTVTTDPFPVAPDGPVPDACYLYFAQANGDAYADVNPDRSATVVGITGPHGQALVYTASIDVHGTTTIYLYGFVSCADVSQAEIDAAIAETGVRVIGRCAHPDGPPVPVMQQVPVLPDGSCDVVDAALDLPGFPSGGWSRSWAQWADDGTGGAVCTRSLVWSSRDAAWVPQA
jgi:hypothetical protein